MNSKSVELQTCPKCGTQSTSLVDIDSGMRLILQQNSGIGEIPSRVCTGCYGSLTDQVSQGVKLRLEQQAKEKNRHMIWKSRVNLVKHARQMMAQKAYPDAAISYEKYIRVLEISYDLKPGQLNPGVFGSTAKSKEITIIATTYWDLLRIYDTMPQYRSRMQVAAQKLADFLPYSPIFPDIIKRAQGFISTAKNPDIIKEFLRRSKASGGRCFIATVAFYPSHPIVIDLRNFRDLHLQKSIWGRAFISMYYRLSPILAKWIEQHTLSRRVTQFALTRLHAMIKFFERPLV